ncbi:MAG TPA: hypothetical protein VLC52_02665 [Anaerolineae bacterium]|nr:hypothetical protein [Anaerolineae bacterium]
MFDSTLILTALLLLGGALVSGYLRGRARDRVLRDFAGYHVTLERTDGRLVWGEMALHTTGMELIYRSDVQDEHHVETSYIVYRDEYPKIQAIYRYCDQMQGPEWEQRQRELERSFHPGFWHRLARRLRNVGSLVIDSLGQAIGILVGQVQSRSRHGITSTGEEYYAQLGRSIVGYVGTSYDPLLERYVGTRVVVEVTEGDVVYEHVGVLKDYTADFFEILDVHYPNQSAIQLRGELDCSEDGFICVRREGETLHLSNPGASSLFLQRLRVGDETRSLQAVLDKDDELELHLPEGTAPDAVIELGVKVIRHLDWIVPRAHALIRHKAERYDPDQVFDIGFVLHLDRAESDEERYVKLLEENPANAAYAVELGQLLFRRGAVDVAERWFQHALQYRQHLADGGKLAERQLAYLRRKRGARRPAA